MDDRKVHKDLKNAAESAARGLRPAPRPQREPQASQPLPDRHRRRRARASSSARTSASRSSTACSAPRRSSSTPRRPPRTPAPSASPPTRCAGRTRRLGDRSHIRTAGPPGLACRPDARDDGAAVGLPGAPALVRRRRLADHSSPRPSRSPPSRPRTSPAAASPCPAASRPRSRRRSRGLSTSARRRDHASCSSPPPRRPPTPGAAVDRMDGRGRRRRRPGHPAEALRRGREAARRRRGRGRPLRTDLPSTSRATPPPTCARRSPPATRIDGVTPYLAGQPAAWAGLQELSKEDLEKAETIGFPIVALILLAVFGSLAAASLPLVLGFVSVILTGGVIFLLSQQMEMSVFVTNMASMIGIGVAVDYSLFILARYREEVRDGTGRRRGARPRRSAPPGSRSPSRGSPWSSRWPGCGWSTTRACARWRWARWSSSRSRS